MTLLTHDGVMSFQIPLYESVGLITQCYMCSKQGILLRKQKKRKSGLHHRMRTNKLFIGLAIPLKNTQPYICVPHKYQQSVSSFKALIIRSLIPLSINYSRLQTLLSKYCGEHCNFQAHGIILSTPNYYGATATPWGPLYTTKPHGLPGMDENPWVCPAT